MKSFLGSLGLGLIAGVLSGLVGIGRGIIIVPALVYFFKMDQKTAQGTSLAVLLPPTGLLAFLEYYRPRRREDRRGDYCGTLAGWIVWWRVCATTSTGDTAQTLCSLAPDCGCENVDGEVAETGHVGKNKGTGPLRKILEACTPAG